MNAPIREGGINPKDLVGAKKAPLALIPQPALIGMADGLLVGAIKYGPFNWREYPVQVMTYVEAAQRHLAAFIDGQDFSEDTEAVVGHPVHHIDHVLAGMAILRDSIAAGIAVDNRPPAGAAAKMLREFDRSLPSEFVRCPLCSEVERREDIVGGVCLTCADAIAFSQNARRGSIQVTVEPPPEDDPRVPNHEAPTAEGY